LPLPTKIFKLLSGVSGVGPSLALTILSGMSLRDLQESIVNERVGDLTSIKGIGRRTAERLVLDLREKVSVSAPSGATDGAGSKDRDSAVSEEAIMALSALGMAPPTARQAVRKAIERDGTEQTVQQLIKRALKER
jgi:Holliday junction DNA helicase RuvA